MADAFKMSDLGLLRYYLGIEVRQSARGTSISQGAYAAKILERSGMAGCNPCQVPMATRLKLSKRSTEPLVDAQHTETSWGVSGTWSYSSVWHLTVGYVSLFRGGHGRTLGLL
ncbi:unnamed protein product [Spirodela intermedia]|uniref:Reverse transcriptase Ty1/copia-type domain-containing protein n=1 Tax=Spirodela intermedia TaxID=51605 RepID=A0ABN7E8Q1_SPIIN|nr:unnamed protein product [Spirodela intermedia]